MTGLALAGAYRRTVAASLDRIWDNVFDWEHLNHLHEGSFADCALIDRGAWGWRVRLTLANGPTQVIELRADRDAGRYVSTTIEGSGAGTEIRVALAPFESHRTDVVVEFHVPESRPDRLAAIGAAYASAYARLWDEDEAMMRARELALSRQRKAGRGGSVDLGGEAEVRACLPVPFEVGGGAFRLVELDGALVAHSTVCPHWLGPLDEAPVIEGGVRCPWHGYRFDVRSGACVSGRSPPLATAPAVTVVGGRVIACLPGGEDPAGDRV